MEKKRNRKEKVKGIERTESKKKIKKRQRTEKK